RAALAECLQALRPDNVQGEYYLTDVVQLMGRRDWPVVAYRVEDPQEIMGINNRVQLAEAESIMRRRLNTKLMLAGVTMIDPSTTYIDAGVEIGQDTVIHPFTILRGKTRIGRGCTVGPQVNLRDTTLGDEVEIRYTVAEEAKIGDQAKIGPFAYLRPGTVLGRGVKVGD